MAMHKHSVAHASRDAGATCSSSATEAAAASEPAERARAGDGPAERAEPSDAAAQRAVDAAEEAAAAGPPAEHVGGLGLLVVLVHGAGTAVARREGGSSVAVAGHYCPCRRRCDGEAEQQGGDEPPLGCHWPLSLSRLLPGGPALVLRGVPVWPGAAGLVVAGVRWRTGWRAVEGFLKCGRRRGQGQGQVKSTRTHNKWRASSWLAMPWRNKSGTKRGR
uniref:Uncharacterized protein n=1 Tax=Zea mays TaxID=4577 RepID=A0A804MW79_MAIZE